MCHADVYLQLIQVIQNDHNIFQKVNLKREIKPMFNYSEALVQCPAFVQENNFSNDQS